MRSDLLHELLQAVAVRAYERGRDDVRSGRISEDPETRVKIHPEHLRRLL